MLARFRARGDARGRAACAEKARRGDVPLRASLRFGVVPCVAGPPTSAFTGSGCGPSCVRVGCCRKAHGSLKNQRIHGGTCKSILHNGADAACAERTLESVYR